MNRIIFCSRSTSDVGSDELMALVARSRRNNERDGLSGMLLYSGQSYLQVLEGPDAALQTAYARIHADRRHRNLRMLTNAEVAEPMFPGWTMGFERVGGEELAQDLEGCTPATLYPLVNPDVITDTGVAIAVLGRYARSSVR